MQAFIRLSSSAFTAFAFIHFKCESPMMTKKCLQDKLAADLATAEVTLPPCHRLSQPCTQHALSLIPFLERARFDAVRARTCAPAVFFLVICWTYRSQHYRSDLT
jgi:hypothetical protein